MNILVCIKQVPDTTDIKWTENNTIQRDGVESIINPYDEYAIEEALKIKRIIDNTKITVLTMGPAQAVEILKKAIAKGCDDGVLISDKKFAGADTYATGKTIASAIKNKLENFDLIICGQFAVDGDTAQTGPSIAGQLNIPQVTYVKEVKKHDTDSIYAIREIEEGHETVKVKLPALICVLKGDYEPSRAKINGIIKAKTSEIKILNMEDIGLSADDTGIKGSPTYVSRAFRPIKNRENCEFCSDFDTLTKKIEEFGGTSNE